jgi:hypothetical protein
MSFQVSPGVITKEVDQTNIVPATSTTVGAYAGHFNWGPSDEIITVGSEKELAELFGSPAQGSSSRSFLTAASFLKYSNALRVSRAIGSTALNSADANPMLIKNKDQFDILSNLDFTFSARYPGAIGDSLTVSYAHVSGSGDSLYDAWPYRNLFNGPPNRSLTGEANAIESNDEIHLVVIDELGLVTGVKGAILETYEGLSLGSNAKSEAGETKFYRDVINNNSSFIYVNSLSDIFDGADTEITPDSVFGVNESAMAAESSLSLSFIQTTETSISIGGGAPVVTTTETEKTVDVFSGYEGNIGNNVRLNVNIVDVSNAPAKSARGWVFFGTPENGDTVTVDGNEFTKAAVADTDEFATIADLASLIDDIAGLSATAANGYVFIEADAGAAGNAITLEVDSDSTEISGPTLTGGFDSEDPAYIDGWIVDTDPAGGHVQYSITIAVDEETVDTVTRLKTDVTLSDIIELFDFVRVYVSGDVPPLAFELDGETIVAGDVLANMTLNIESIIPFDDDNQATVKVLSFTGGDAIIYSNETVINTFRLLGGSDGVIAPGNVVGALDIFSDRETVDIDFLFAEAFFGEGQITIDNKLYEAANFRKDILATISAPLEIISLTSNNLKKQAVIARFDNPTYASSSYVTFDSSPGYTYNKYADRYEWIPSSGHVAGLCANADLVADPWFSPAGFNRGQLKGVIKLAFNPNKTDRDDLYKKRINSIVSIPGEGIVLYGDKTALTKPSAFDRINVRRLFNVMKRVISTASKYQLFELNDEFTRASFKNLIEPYLRDVQGRRGITEFAVICDETNNTGEVIDSNNFIGDIFVKPARSINNIELNFIATRTGIDFREIVGS